MVVPEAGAFEAEPTASSFHCNGCGACCRALRVAVTVFDVARLAAATGHVTHNLVQWLTPEEVDMTSEPQTFVELREGRRLMVLAQVAGACLLLGTDDRCTAYAARPADCRAFPFDFEVAAEATPPRRKLTLLPLDGCNTVPGPLVDLHAVEAMDRVRWEELRRYQQLVARWNRQVWHRRRLLKSVGSAEQFLNDALAWASAG